MGTRPGGPAGPRPNPGNPSETPPEPTSPSTNSSYADQRAEHIRRLVAEARVPAEIEDRVLGMFRAGIKAAVAKRTALAA